MKVTVVPYRPDWKKQFTQTKAELAGVLAALNPVIEHIGSTAVEGLAAKPIIDVSVGVGSEDDFGRVVALMAKLDDYLYYQVFNATMPQRRLFVKLDGPAGALGFPMVFSQLEGIPHEAINEHRVAHVHVWALGTADWIRHLAFRDYLQAHDEVRQQYEALKIKLSQQEWEHGMAYNDGKNDFIKRTEATAVAWFAKKSKGQVGESHEP